MHAVVWGQSWESKGTWAFFSPPGLHIWESWRDSHHKTAVYGLQSDAAAGEGMGRGTQCLDLRLFLLWLACQWSYTPSETSIPGMTRVLQVDLVLTSQWRLRSFMGAGFSTALWLILQLSLPMQTFYFQYLYRFPGFCTDTGQSLETVRCLCAKEKVVGSTHVHVPQLTFYWGFPKC